MRTKDIVIMIICLLIFFVATSILITENSKSIAIETLNSKNNLTETIQNISYEDSYIESVIESEKETQNLQEEIVKVEEEKRTTKIELNFAGDCTIGYDTNFGYTNSFNEVLEKNDYGYFFSNMEELFANDDLTIVNLEGTFTDNEVKVPKKFNFKGPKDYVNVLTSGDIEVVNIANNHTRDYGQKGYDDTINTLNEVGIGYFGYDKYYIYNKDDIKIGFAGIYSIESMNCTANIDKAIAYFKENNVNTIILSFHWGIERSYKQSALQQKVAHYAIDNGADLIIGHHPHVLQGIEVYNDKYIVYSLGNFSFGGNKNPPDKDTMVFNITYEYEDNKVKDTEVVIYPASVSSAKNKNDYRPTLLKGNEYTRVLSKIGKYSEKIQIKTTLEPDS